MLTYKRVFEQLLYQMTFITLFSDWDQIYRCFVARWRVLWRQVFQADERWRWFPRRVMWRRADTSSAFTSHLCAIAICVITVLNWNFHTTQIPMNIDAQGPYSQSPRNFATTQIYCLAPYTLLFTGEVRGLRKWPLPFHHSTQIEQFLHTQSYSVSEDFLITMNNKLPVLLVTWSIKNAPLRFTEVK
jgi:hypothetical protein